MRKNKLYIPSEFRQDKNKEDYSSTFLYINTTELVLYIPKREKCVIGESTIHSVKKVLKLQNLKIRSHFLLGILWNML